MAINKQVGVVGLGIMGGAFAKHLRAARFKVTGYDVAAARRAALRKLGGVAAESTAEVASVNRILITSLPSLPAFEAALFGKHGIADGARKGTIVIEASTLPLEVKEDARKRLAKTGVILLDCPISGTGAQAALKDIVIYASGDKRACARCKTVFAGFARNAYYCGAFGAGSKLKFIANLLGNLQPLLVLVLAAAFLGEVLTGAKTLALCLGLAGVTLIALPAIAGPDAYGISGPLLALGASASLALGNVILKAIGSRHDLLTMTAWQLTLGGLPLLAVSAIVERGAAVIWSASFVALLFGLAMAGTALPYVVWNHLARLEEIGRLTLFLLITPVLGVVLAGAVFGERLGALEWIGIAAIVAGVGIVTLRPSVGSPRLPRRRIRA